MPSGVGPARRPQQFDKDYVDNSGYVAKLRCNPIAPLHWRRHYYLMGSGRTRPMEEADLFSKASLPEPSSSANLPRPAPSTKDVTTAALPLRYLLPRDLQGGIKQLTDQEFAQLLAAVLAEQQRRGRKPPSSSKTSRIPLVNEVALPLTPAKLNAIRAAFKAGVAPSRIARQFGVSQSDVRKALASGTSKRPSSRD